MPASLPPYPAELIKAGVEGHFEGDLTITETGKVSRVVIVQSAGARLDRVARMHASRLQFVPARLDGKPVASLYRITFDWRTSVP